MKIGIIGAGNVAWNLVAALAGSRFEVVQIHSRGGESARRLAAEFGVPDTGREPGELRSDLDLVLIATSDHSVGDVATAYAEVSSNSKAIFAHTSGSIPLAQLAPLDATTGVFYPLQTFTKGHLADWKGIPVFLEGNPEAMTILNPLATHLSERVATLDSAQRLRLHLGAVFASNFANYMWLKAEEVVNDLPEADFSAYGPLIRECMTKALRYGPVAAHTGPARRGDQVTMDKHLELLEETDQELYRIVSMQIAARFEEEG